MSENLYPAPTPFESAPAASAAPTALRLIPAEPDPASSADRIESESGSADRYSTTNSEPTHSNRAKIDPTHGDPAQRRTDRNPPRPRPYNADRADRSDRAPRTSVVALIDAEFWRWWQDLPDSTSEREVAIAARQTVRDALAQTRDALQLQRMVWVSEARLQGLDDVRSVTVHDNEADDGWPLVRALSQALFDLAAGGVVNTVLLASDDDRLVLTVDEVQRRGLRVLMLQGEDKKLSDEWRRLLRLADRALVPGEARGASVGPHQARSGRSSDDRAGWGNDDRSVRANEDRSAHNGRHDDTPWRQTDERGDSSRSDRMRAEDAPQEPPTAEVLQTLNESANQWWSDLDEASREALREAIPQSRGLPRDFDRQLLIAAARTLDRQLSVPEKHALRGAARAMAVGAEAA